MLAGGQKSLGHLELRTLRGMGSSLCLTSAAEAVTYVLFVRPFVNARLWGWKKSQYA